MPRLRDGAGEAWYHAVMATRKPVITEEEARLVEHLDRHPGDFASRLVLADLLYERGDEDGARCQRWLGQHRKYADDNPSGGSRRGQPRWRWWGGSQMPEQGRLHATLPVELTPHMPAGDWCYPTRAGAEAVLAQALARLEAQ